MAYITHIKNDGVELTFAGTTSLNEMIEAKSRYGGRSDYAHLRYRVLNMLGVTEFNAEGPQLKAMREVDEVIALSVNQIKMAIVATDADILAKAGVYAERPGEPNMIIQVFSNLAEARAWAKDPEPQPEMVASVGAQQLK